MKLIDTANNIEDAGMASIYDAEFEEMEKQLAETQKKLEDANISKEHLEDMDKQVQRLKNEVCLLSAIARY